MIGKLKGIVDEIGEDWMILDVAGVGYLVGCSGKTLSALKPGDATVVYIETYVREDQLKLFGFSNRTELDMFRLLQTVQGVGAKVALAIQSILSPSEVASAVSMQDKAMVGRASGVGPKLAERIVTELKSKVANFSSVTAGMAALVAPAKPTPASDAVSALVNLGYSREAAAGVVSRIATREGDDVPTDKLIWLGLREIASL